MEKVRLEEIADIYLGLTHTPQYVEKGIPFLSVKDISNGEIDFSRCHYITEEEFNTLPVGAKPQVGDMLFCRVGTIGKPIIIKEGTSKFGSFVSLGFLRIKRKDYLIEYVKYWMNSNNFFQQVLKNVKGVAQVNLNTSWLKKFELPRIEIKEQKKVISQLDKLQKIIDLRKKQIEELEELIKSQFVEMFETEKRYVKLEDVCIFINGDRGKNYPSADKISKNSNGVPFINAGLLTNNTVDWENMNYISEETYNKLRAGKIQKDDILYCLRGSLGKHAIIDFDNKGAIASSHVILRANQNKIQPNFLLIQLGMDEIIRQQNQANNGSSQPNLSASSVKKYKIKLPDIEMQNKFVNIVKQIDKQKFILEKTLKETEELQESIMNKYFR